MMEIPLSDTTESHSHIRTVIITGANSGIGYETALGLAKRGDRIVMACRDLTRAKKAADQIKAETKNNNVEVEELDLAFCTSIRQFAKRVNAKYERLDALVNCAGVMMCPHWQTKDGFEYQMGVNYLGHFLLTNLLLDLLKKSSPSRIVTVSSRAYKSGRINWDDLNSKQSYNSMKAYAQSKLANVMFNVELAERLKDTGVTAVCVDPGLVRAELSSSTSGCFGVFLKLLRPLFWLLGKSSAEGADTIIYCANMVNISSYHGAYFSSSKPSELSTRASDPTHAHKLWNLSAQLVQLNDYDFDD